LSNPRQTQETREDPRVTRTRGLLVQSFNDLLNEKGFDRVTVQDIADRAQVNRATFYSHFRDKYVLFDYVAGESFRKALHESVPPESRLSSTTLQTLIRVVADYLEWHLVHCALSIQTQFGQQLEEQVRHQLHQVFLEWLRAKRSPGDRNDRADSPKATVASWGVYGLAISWCRDAGRGASVEFSAQAEPLIMTILATST